MTRYLPSSTFAAALLAGALFASATGGAVAGSLITGKQIKDGSVTGKDLKDNSVAAADLAPGTVTAGPAGPAGPRGAAGPPGSPGPATVPGYQIVQDDLAVPANNPDSLTTYCPAGKRVLGVSAFWLSSQAGMQSVIDVTGLSGTGYTDGIPTNDTLRVRIVCATAS